MSRDDDPQARAARQHIGSAQTPSADGIRSHIAALFEPRSVALVGASERSGSLGTVVLENLLAAGFGGTVHAVNPSYERLQGQSCHRSLRDIGAPIDLAVIVTPAASVPAILEECGELGVPAAVVISAGFRETGAEGRALEDKTLAVARRHDIRFVGPNCLGVMRPGIGLNATFSHSMSQPGRIALVSQSGALCTAMLDWAAPRDVGFSSVISTGIGSDVDFGEILDFLVLDPVTDAIMLYVEGLRDARRFMSALRAAARAKPVIVMKSGRHAEGRSAAVSHTGALVGSDDVFDAALNRAGVVRVHSYTHFFAVAATLDAGLRTRGPRLAIVTNGGGPGVMAADYAADKKLPLATLSGATLERLHGLLPAAWSGANPVDVLGDADPQRYVAALQACLEDDAVDGVLAILIPQALTDAAPVAERVVELVAHQRKPVLTCWMGDATMRSSRELFQRNDIPTYHTPEAAVEAFAAAAAYQANQQLLLQVPEPLDPHTRPDIDGARLIIETALAEDRALLDLVESKGLLAAFGLPILASMPAHSAAEALAIAEEIGFPVAMKIHSRDITHKSDVGGIRLGLNDGNDVRSAYREMTRAVAEKCPQAAIEGVLLERMWRPVHGRELMIGVINDPVFGPVVSVGLGGTMVEVIGDRAIGLPPLNRYLARRMIADTRAAKYLAAFRGQKAADQRALEEVILKVSEMVCELPGIEEMDINPLIVDDSGAIAVDARVLVRRVSAAARPYAHMAIHPFPSHLATEKVLLDGTRLSIRPIRPEDAVLEREFVNGLSDRSRYLRFMQALREITPQMLSRFTQIDYDREMALIALVPAEAGQRQIGVARYVVDPDGENCEFAVVVADDWQNRGIATTLLKRLIDVARERRLRSMYGLVLEENRGMLDLAQNLGFERSRSEEDPMLAVLRLQL